jgi:3-dehydroquinate dehydratase/shikimate dehydrogenase
MRSSGAAVVKVAVKADRLSDCLALARLGDDRADTVLIAMGDRGFPSRVLATRFGSVWTYAGSIGEVGQVSAKALLDEYRFRDVDEATELYGVTGLRVSHSVSPAMHNAAFRASGRNAVYLPLPAADADDFVAFAEGVGLAGASVTIPFKVALVAVAEEVSPAVRAVGALNTLGRSRDRWRGHNTDVAGFLRPLDDQGVDLAGTRAAILGAGGSARAVAVALASRGADVSVHARRQDRAAEVAAVGQGRSGPWPPSAGTWDLLVNCTPVGMHPRVEETPLDREQLTGRCVYDLVYNPADTRLLQDARLAGCRTIGGLDMLVAQAEEQSRWWTGVAPPPGVMRDAAMRRLSEFAGDEHHVV